MPQQTQIDSSPKVTVKPAKVPENNLPKPNVIDGQFLNQFEDLNVQDSEEFLTPDSEEFWTPQADIPHDPSMAAQRILEPDTVQQKIGEDPSGEQRSPKPVQAKTEKENKTSIADQHRSKKEWLRIAFHGVEGMTLKMFRFTHRNGDRHGCIKN